MSIDRAISFNVGEIQKFNVTDQHVVTFTPLNTNVIRMQIDPEINEEVTISKVVQPPFHGTYTFSSFSNVDVPTLFHICNDRIIIQREVDAERKLFREAELERRLSLPTVAELLKAHSISIDNIQFKSEPFPISVNDVAMQQMGGLGEGLFRWDDPENWSDFPDDYAIYADFLNVKVDLLSFTIDPIGPMSGPRHTNHEIASWILKNIEKENRARKD